MFKRFFVCCQYILPQHLLSRIVGKLANTRTKWFKNGFINLFIRFYQVDMSEALLENIEEYACFNDFFIRKLKASIRPLDIDPTIIASPADGNIAEIGSIKQDQLIQAKGFYFDLQTLLGNKELALSFHNGSFATLYLAPHNYHRFHMPFDGKLIKQIYIPGKLFSVNRTTTDLIPNLYSRNERLVLIFETSIGMMAVVLVGAMIVGSIQTVWMDQPVRCNNIEALNNAHTNHISLKKGQELGFFKMGSTIIILFEENKITWNNCLKTDTPILHGQFLGKIIR